MLTAEIIEGFRHVAIASLADAIDKVGGRRGYLHHSVKNQINARRMVGPAVTTLHAPTPDFLPPLAALDLIEDSAAGSVIVIGVHGDTDLAFWGGIMSAGAFAKQHAGALLAGGVRDVQEIQRDYDLPVFAPHVSPGTSLGRTATIAANIPVMVGGIVVHPGDLVVGDVDGVCIIRPQHAADELKMAREIDAREAEQARLIVEVKSLKQGLAKYGRI